MCIRSKNVSKRDGDQCSVMLLGERFLIHANEVRSSMQ